MGLHFVKVTQKLMVLGGDYSDKIFECAIDDSSDMQSVYDWKLRTHLKMPHVIKDERHFDVVSYGHSLIGFYFGISTFSDIWCLDLLDEKWYRSKFKVPQRTSSAAYVLKDKLDDANVHLLDFEHNDHYKMNIHNIFPSKMLRARRKRFHPLVIGFIKEQENGILNIPIPYVLRL